MEEENVSINIDRTRTLWNWMGKKLSHLFAICRCSWAAWVLTLTSKSHLRQLGRRGWPWPVDHSQRHLIKLWLDFFLFFFPSRYVVHACVTCVRGLASVDPCQTDNRLAGPTLKLEHIVHQHGKRWHGRKKLIQLMERKAFVVVVVMRGKVYLSLERTSLCLRVSSKK